MRLLTLMLMTLLGTASYPHRQAFADQAGHESSIAFDASDERHGDGSVIVSGKLKQWHNVRLSLAGPFATELDTTPNPFTDYRMEALFVHETGARHLVPGYFAADGDAANSSASAGNQWRVHFAPDRVGKWQYTISFRCGRYVALDRSNAGVPCQPFDGIEGSLAISETDKTGRDLRASGRLEYVGSRYLRFAGSKTYFLKIGADAPETLLAYAEFDNTHAGRPNRAPLKTWEPHRQDWRAGDPTWKGTQGKGLIGAVNYLSSKGCNAFSFLTYNAGGDGDNVWPFVHRDDKLHYDCSKLDQWGIVFDHATTQGMYLHFKMQETENDDRRAGQSENSTVPTALDGGKLGPERKLYCRELIARFGHNLALNWNLGEENTQSTDEQKDMIDYLSELDTYDHPIVVHTFPDQQDRVYDALLGEKSKLTGVSLQNSHIRDTHWQTVKWVRKSTAAGKPWVVAFDESGSAAHGQCPDLGYQGFDGHDRAGKLIYTEHEVRRQTLWGTLMGGGAGVEYYFGYQFVENDLVCEDWRSRDRSWDYCRHAVRFFHSQEIPFWKMDNHDELVGNSQHDNTVYCLADPGAIYVIYLTGKQPNDLKLSALPGAYSVHWFNPREGAPLQEAGREVIADPQPGGAFQIPSPPSDPDEDWVCILRRSKPQ